LSPKPRASRQLARAGVGGLRALGARYHWPAVWTLLALAFAVVALVGLLPARMFAVTVSIDARTEVLEVELDPRREYVWTLPAGSYSLLGGQARSGCDTPTPLDVTCEYDGPTAIVVRDGPTVRFELVPQGSGSPRIALSLTPRHDGARAARASVEIRSTGDALLAGTSEYLGYESAPVERWRIPLTVRHIQIGESLSDGVIDSNESGTRQPIMTSGDVRIFARRILSSGNRYQVQQERFDPADVVQIPQPRQDDALLLGLLALNAAENVFELTAQTDGRRIVVRRLGAEHAITPSMWSIVSNDPAALALWATLIALLGLTSYHSQRVNFRLARSQAERKDRG
jgi:hypothetical protein